MLAITEKKTVRDEYIVFLLSPCVISVTGFKQGLLFIIGVSLMDFP